MQHCQTPFGFIFLPNVTSIQPATFQHHHRLTFSKTTPAKNTPNSKLLIWKAQMYHHHNDTTTGIRSRPPLVRNSRHFVFRPRSTNLISFHRSPWGKVSHAIFFFSSIGTYCPYMLSGLSHYHPYRSNESPTALVVLDFIWDQTAEQNSGEYLINGNQQRNTFIISTLINISFSCMGQIVPHCSSPSIHLLPKTLNISSEPISVVGHFLI